MDSRWFSGPAGEVFSPARQRGSALSRSGCHYCSLHFLACTSETPNCQTRLMALAKTDLSAAGSLDAYAGQNRQMTLTNLL
ncbi:hypothetical protein SRHO_G00264550 [Serrasalmus rhombeus]